MADPENTLVIETTKGRVVIALRPDLAPGHVERIKTLARQGFYDGIVFHRVIDGFMAQTGCPNGTGTGGSELPDLKAEFNEEPHERGTVSMARTSAPHSANSQFFICFDDAALPRRAVHGLGQGRRRHGERRQDQARRARARPRPDRLHEGPGRCGLVDHTIRRMGKVEAITCRPPAPHPEEPWTERSRVSRSLILRRPRSGRLEASS